MQFTILHAQAASRQVLLLLLRVCVCVFAGLIRFALTGLSIHPSSHSIQPSHSLYTSSLLMKQRSLATECHCKANAGRSSVAYEGSNNRTTKCALLIERIVNSDKLRFF